MPSEDRIRTALDALARPRDTFRSALVSAMEELTSYLETRRAPAEERNAREQMRLGAFAAGHIDITRFAQFTDSGARVGPASLERIQRGIALLGRYVAQGDELFHVRVESGEDLRDTVRHALASRGRIFSAARNIEMLRAGQPVLHEHDDALPFRQWRRGERLLAPPLVVELAGADLQPAGLADYMDGAQKIVLLVDGECAPAPLVRLIMPGTYVTQCADAAALERFAAWDGPGVAALVPTGAALFTHDPSRGSTLRQRLSIESMPEATPRMAARQKEELEWLAELDRVAGAASAGATGAADAAAAPAEPADQLAGWLLRLGATEPAT